MNAPSAAQTWSAVLLVAATLVLSACDPTSPTETTAPPPSSTPSASPTETPTPTPTPTPEAEVENPAVIGTWIIDGIGVGPIDMDGDAAVLATYLPGIFDDACDTKIYHRDDGLSFTFPVGGGQVHAIKMDGGPGALADSPHTAAGIALGSTSAQIESAYPGIAFEDDGVRTPHYVWPTDGRFVHILMDGGAVSGFFVSNFEQLAMDLC